MSKPQLLADNEKSSAVAVDDISNSKEIQETGPALAGADTSTTEAGSDKPRYTRPENFVRLSKAEKRILRYEKNRSKMLAKRKVVKKRRAMKQNASDELLSQEEWAIVKRQRREESERQTEKLRTAMTNGHLTIAVDLGFTEKNSTRELRSLAQQLTYAYSKMKKEYDVPPKLHLAEYCGEAKRVFELSGAGHWLVNRHEEPVEEVFRGKRLVYLSPDAEEALDEVDADAVYIVGGIVDRTVNSNLSKLKAAGLGIETRRFPVKEYLPDCRKVVLNVDRAIHVLVRFAEEGDWVGILRETMPKRHKRERKQESSQGLAGGEDVKPIPSSTSDP